MGYLRPAALPAPLQDQALYEALQAAVVGITGLDGTLVRPRWQPEPSLLPPAATCWIAVGVTDRDADTFPWQGVLEDGTYQMRRNEEFTLFCTVYDLGYGGLADGVAGELRDGLMVPQNLEDLAASEIYLVSDADLAVAPVLFKQRWMYGVDLKIRFRRQITRDYAVPTLAGASAKLYTDDGQAPRSIVPRPVPVFTLDDSTLDGPDVLG